MDSGCGEEKEPGEAEYTAGGLMGASPVGLSGDDYATGIVSGGPVSASLAGNSGGIAGNAGQPVNTIFTGTTEATISGDSSPGIPLAMVARLAQREDINNAIRECRPPEARPELPLCYARDLRVPKTFREAMNSEYSNLWEDSMQREYFGLLDGGTFAPVE